MKEVEEGEMNKRKYKDKQKKRKIKEKCIPVALVATKRRSYYSSSSFCNPAL